ncbi:hypothetical protein BH11PSE3_BH11PSE3_08260 [soil metagenome]
MRAAIGVVLIGFSLYSLVRPKLRSMPRAGAVADAGAGLAAGLIGGATGLAGIVPTAWASLRGWASASMGVLAEASFRKLVLGLLLLAGIALAASWLPLKS